MAPYGALEFGKRAFRHDDHRLYRCNRERRDRKLPTDLAGIHSLRGTAERRTRGSCSENVLRVIAAVAVATAFLAAAGAAAAATIRKPTVAGFTASPLKLYNPGGIVTLSATVTNARRCLFTSITPITGLPATVPCTTGPVSTTVTLPANTGKSAVKRYFQLSVIGTKTVTTKAVGVTVRPESPPPAVSALAAIPSTLTSAGGNVTLTDNVRYGDFCLFTSSPTLAGLPVTLPCAGGAEGGADTVIADVDVPANTGTSATNYAITMTATGTATATTALTLVVPPPTTPPPLSPVTDATSLASDGEGDGYCAVLSSGGVDCWGYNDAGQVGNGTIGGPGGVSGYDTAQVVTGVTDAVSIASSVNADSYCALLSTGGVDCWGANGAGELGNGRFGGPDSCDGGDYCFDTAQPVTGITDAVSVTSGANAGYCALRSTGGVDCWGDNQFGELGDGTVDGPDGAIGYDTPSRSPASPTRWPW